MHEMSICNSLIRETLKIKQQHTGCQVAKIKLQVGPLSSVEPVLLAQAFMIAKQQCGLAQAELVIEKTALKVQCQHCNKVAQVTINNLTCPFCHSSHTQLLSGDELLIETIEFVNTAVTDNNNPGLSVTNK